MKPSSLCIRYNEHRGYQCYVPRPVMEKLENPASIKFVIKDENIAVETSVMSNIYIVTTEKD